MPPLVDVGAVLVVSRIELAAWAGPAMGTSYGGGQRGACDKSG